MARIVERRSNGIRGLDTFRSPDELNVVVETPKGSRNKYKYDEAGGVFMLHKLLTAGAVFPFDFGFLPSTRGEDGDPLDILILMEEPARTGCLVPVRLIGGIDANQTENCQTRRNDRLIGVATSSHRNSGVRSIRDIRPELLAEIEHFFVSYNEMEQRRFRVRGRYGVSRALKLIRAGQREFARGKDGGG
jgi:inorganic pyrophosphatase